MFHSCGICGKNYVDADAVETNYDREDKKWWCDDCLKEKDALPIAKIKGE